MSRKIIQIAVSSPSKHDNATLFALCDDGTLWSLNRGERPKPWEPVQGVPQPEPESGAAEKKDHT